MAEVSVAGVADGFDPLQKAGTVETVRDDNGLHWLRKRGPSCAGLKFLGRVEQDGAAEEAGINTRLEQAAHQRAKRALRPGFMRDVVFVRAQLLSPLGVGLFDPSIRGRVAVLCEVQDIRPFQHRLLKMI